MQFPGRNKVVLTAAAVEGLIRRAVEGSIVAYGDKMEPAPSSYTGPTRPRAAIRVLGINSYIGAIEVEFTSDPAPKEEDSPS